MAPVTEVVRICTELSANVTVTVTVIVEPTAAAQPVPAVSERDSIPPGFLFPLHVPAVRVHPAGSPVKVKVGPIVEWIGTSPVFFSTIENVAAPEVGEATSFT
jgi:hypothetical protein